jgi:hypothetical protein
MAMSQLERVIRTLVTDAIAVAITGATSTIEMATARRLTRRAKEDQT